MLVRRIAMIVVVALGFSTPISVGSSAVRALPEDVFDYQVDAYIYNGVINCNAELMFVSGSGTRHLFIEGVLMPPPPGGDHHFGGGGWRTEGYSSIAGYQHDADLTGTWRCRGDFYIDFQFVKRLEMNVVVTD